MHLKQVYLRDYRSYSELTLAPSSELNILVGPNGHGKTNILEAIYLLATTRSLRSRRDQELVRMGADLCRVVGAVERSSRADVTLEIDVVANHKVGKVNGIRHARLVDLLSEFNAVQFSPTDVDLVTGPPTGRRSFLNLQIAQARGRYAYSLLYYKRVLDQRNRLLKNASHSHSYRPVDSQALEALTEQLIEHGMEIFDCRTEFVSSLAIYADRVHRELAGSEASLSVLYQPGWHGADPRTPPSKNAFRSALESVSSEELRRGMTLAGPHRDDLEIFISGMDARIYSSRGEQRTAALSLKLAEFLLLQEKTGDPPVMLLDDVLSELDDDRRLRVMQNVGPCQSFLTGATLRSFPQSVLDKSMVYYVANGGAQVHAHSG